MMLPVKNMKMAMSIVVVLTYKSLSKFFYLTKIPKKHTGEIIKLFQDFAYTLCPNIVHLTRKIATLEFTNVGIIVTLETATACLCNLKYVLVVSEILYRKRKTLS